MGNGKFQIGDRVLSIGGEYEGQRGYVRGYNSTGTGFNVNFDGTFKWKAGANLKLDPEKQPDYDESGVSLGGAGEPMKVDYLGPCTMTEEQKDVCRKLAETEQVQHIVQEQARAGDEGSAKKLDLGKAPIKQGFDKYFAHAIFAIAMVSEYGHRKYEDGDVYSGNCLRVPDGLARYGDAERRHGIKEIIEGAYDDSDSGLPHLAQKAWNALMELERAIRDGVIEVRRGNDIVNGKPVLGTARAVKI